MKQVLITKKFKLIYSSFFPTTSRIVRIQVRLFVSRGDLTPLKVLLNPKRVFDDSDIAKKVS